MAELNYAIGTGANDYVACIIAPAPPPEQGKAAFKSPTLRLLNTETPVPANGVQVTVPAGAPLVAGALRDADGNVPTGVTITVTMPNGTVLGQSTEPYAEGTVVTIQDGSLTDVCVMAPQSGVWTIQAVSTNTDDEYQFFFSTMPTADVQDTIDTTLESMSDAETMEAFARQELVGGSWGCWWCKVGCAALGVLVVGIAAAGATFVTAGAAPCIAVGLFVGASAATAGTVGVALILGAIASLTAGVGIAIAYICSWAHACPAPSGAAA